MSYSFDYGTPGNNARFVIVDPWVTPSKNVAPGNGYNYGYSIAEQQSWISSRLNEKTVTATCGSLMKATSQQPASGTTITPRAWIEGSVRVVWRPA
jgi:hypothetical protein